MSDGVTWHCAQTFVVSNAAHKDKQINWKKWPVPVLMILVFFQGSLHLFEIPYTPALVEISLGRCVEAQVDPPALSRNGLNPVLLFAFGSCWSVVKIKRTIFILNEILARRLGRSFLFIVDQCAGIPAINSDGPELFGGRIGRYMQCV